VNIKQIVLTLGLLTLITQSVLAGPNEDLLEAVKKSDLAGIEAAVKKGANVNTFYSIEGLEGETVLMVAVLKNLNIELIKALLAVPGIDVNAKDKNGTTALVYALEFNYPETLKILLKAPGVNANIQNEFGGTFLMRAALSGHTEIVKVLLAVPGINLELKTKDDKKRPEFAHKTAFDLAKTSEIKTLIQDAIDKQAGTKTSMTSKTARSVIAALKKDESLFAAAGNGDLVGVQTAIKNGANINAKGEVGQTALMVALWKGKNIDLVKTLLAVKEIDVNAQDISGWTALMRAAFNNEENPDFLKVLLAVPGIKVNTHNMRGDTALGIVAEHNKNTGCLKALLAAPGINVNEKNEFGYTALMKALYNENPDFLKILLAAPGINVNAQNESRQTALMKAAEYNRNFDSLKVLLTAPGINVNVQDSNGGTALMEAVFSQSLDYLEALLAAPGINLTLKTNNNVYQPEISNKTALDLAKTPEIKKLIQDALDKQAAAKKAQTLPAAATPLKPVLVTP